MRDLKKLARTSIKGLADQPLKGPLMHFWGVLKAPMFKPTTTKKKPLYSYPGRLIVFLILMYVI